LILYRNLAYLGQIVSNLNPANQKYEAYL